MVTTVSTMAWLQIPRRFFFLFTLKSCRAMGRMGSDSCGPTPRCSAAHRSRSGGPGAAQQPPEHGPAPPRWGCCAGRDGFTGGQGKPSHPDRRVSTSRLTPAWKGLLRCLITAPGSSADEKLLNKGLKGKAGLQQGFGECFVGL